MIYLINDNPMKRNKRPSLNTDKRGIHPICKEHITPCMQGTQNTQSDRDTYHEMQIRRVPFIVFFNS